MEYLGHVVRDQRVVMDQMKVKVVLDRPEPRSIDGLQGFLSLTNYY